MQKQKWVSKTVNVIYHFHLVTRPHFLWVYRRDNPRGMLGEHEKSCLLSNVTISPS